MPPKLDIVEMWRLPADGTQVPLVGLLISAGAAGADLRHRRRSPRLGARGDHHQQDQNDRADQLREGSED
jgi:hypothetical protein